MVTKKLYSFRAEPQLLEALREKAETEGVTVSELIHRLLYESMDMLPSQEVERQSCDGGEFVNRREIEGLKATVEALVKQVADLDQGKVTANAPN